jgi:hypothetical protein
MLTVWFNLWFGSAEASTVTTEQIAQATDAYPILKKSKRIRHFRLASQAPTGAA